MVSTKATPPLQGNYPLTVAFVLLALCPDLFWSTSMPLPRTQISQAQGWPSMASDG